MSYGQPPGGGGYGYPPASQPGYGAPPGGGFPPMGPPGPATDPFAYASLGVGVAGLLTCFCCGIFGIVLPFGGAFGGVVSGVLSLVGMVLGFVSVSRINGQPETYKGKELAIAGAIVNLVVFLLCLAIVVLMVVGGVAWFATAQQSGGYY